MIFVRKSEERGHNVIDWLNSYHTFSFADYYDEKWIHFGFIRVINEDYIQPTQGFEMHPHRDMEIITYVISGALEHKDSMGNGSVILPGEIQRMSAGTGVKHSEFNHSDREVLHLLQIWILPAQKGIQPGYEQKTIHKNLNQLTRIGSNYPTTDTVMVHQDVLISVGFFEKNQQMAHTLKHRYTWLQLVKGNIRVNNHILHAGDGMGIQNERQLLIQCDDETEFLLFEMQCMTS